MLKRRGLSCFSRNARHTSLDFDQQERITTYNGLESCILNSQSFDTEGGTSRGDGCFTDPFDDDVSSCSSSSNAFGSFSSLWTTMKKDDQCGGEISSTDAKIGASPDAETMKEKFAKLLLGEDVTGGTKGVSTALALSNAIGNVAATVFGELWKLEPLSEEKKSKWRQEMDWLLSPTNYMVELVPAKQSCSNGGILEIMKPKGRADVQMNLPALKKLDSMLLEVLDSMVDTEFSYAEVGSRAEGRSRRWWLPSPQVPAAGLSDTETKRLLHQGRLIYQVFKAAKLINENVLLEMPVPSIIKEALPKSIKSGLGEELYRLLSEESLSAEEMFNRLHLKTEHHALETINRLETAISIWQRRISAEQEQGKSPARTSWSFAKDPITEMDKMDSLLHQAEMLVKEIKMKFPNLPLTFIDATKIRYGKDVGHSILEAYSRVLAGLAFSILSRIGDILQEDITSNPNSPVAVSHLVGARIPGISDSPILDRVRQYLVHQADGKTCSSSTLDTEDASDHSDAKVSPVAAISTLSRTRVWCMGKQACKNVSSTPNSP